jgi:altronate hydrolase
MPDLIIIDPLDNVGVVPCNTPKGTDLVIGDDCFAAATDLALGSKIAVRRIEPGTPVIKYGVVIGTATQEIERGEYVHVHNLRSDYMQVKLIER